MTTLIISQILGGIASGMILVLLALGLTLIFGHLRVVNFAHGAFYMLGAYTGLEVVRRLGNFWLGLLVVPVVLAVLGILFERTLVSRLYGRSLQDLLLLTFGVSFILVELVKIAYGKMGLSFDMPQALMGAQRAGDLVFPNYQLFLVFASAAVVGIVYLFLERTDVGLIVRAGTQDNLMVQALGVNFSRTRTLVFGIGIGLAGLAGLMTAPRMGVNPDMGMAILIYALVTVVVGGMGSFWGAAEWLSVFTALQSVRG
jgi:branched-chain amino acid transport system permease protein